MIPRILTATFEPVYYDVLINDLTTGENNRTRLFPMILRAREEPSVCHTEHGISAMINDFRIIAAHEPSKQNTSTRAMSFR
jgi:hypothetical protein